MKVITLDRPSNAEVFTDLHSEGLMSNNFTKDSDLNAAQSWDRYQPYL
jgi:hypothetical protein